MNRKSLFRPSRGQLIFVLITLGTLYIVLPQIGIFEDSFSILSSASVQYLFVAFGFVITVNLFSGANYTLLAKHKVKYARTLLIQLAGNFVNRLLPAGIGGMGINYMYLKANKHTSAQAASVVAVNNLLGGLGNFILLAYIFLVLGYSFDNFKINLLSTDHNLINYGLIFVLLIIFVAGIKYRSRITENVSAFIKQVFEYRKRLRRLGLALVSSIFLTLSNVLCLYYSATALGFHLSLATILVVLTVGVAFGSVTPTPGGLGGVEAAIIASLVVFSIPAGSALAIALVFRLISFWIPIIAGIGFLYLAERNNYFKKA